MTTRALASLFRAIANLLDESRDVVIQGRPQKIKIEKPEEENELGGG